MNAKTLLSAVLVVLVVASGAAYAAPGFTLDPSAEQYPKTHYQEDDLTITSHDMETMETLEWENDNGEIVELDAYLNGTDSGEKITYLPTHVEDSEFAEYPRKDDEENNSASALDASEWSAGGAQSANISVTQADGSTASSVQAINIATDGTVATADEAYVSYSNQSITTDVQKRHVQLILDQTTLDSAMEVQFRDSGGDYAVAELNTSRDATATDVIANVTADGIVFQAQVGELPVVSGDDGTVDAIEEIRVVAVGDVDATITAINVEKKSNWDMGTTRVLDTSTDDTDDYMDETVEQNRDGGPIQITELSTLGDWSADSVIHNLEYLNLEYRMQDNPDASVEFRNAENYPGFAVILDVSDRNEIPTGYDLSHGDIDLVTEQTFLSERYIQLRYAEAVGDTDTEDIDSWTDLTGSLGDQDTTITVDSTVQPGATNVVQFEVKLLEDQQNALQLTTGGAVGFWGDAGGSGNPFMNMWNWAVGGVVGLLGAIGVKFRGA